MNIPLRVAMASVVAVSAGLLVGGTSACSGQADPSRVTVVLAPSQDDFIGNPPAKGVSTYLEARCGSLDCHGQLGRPLRIFSSNGLRLPADGGPNPITGGSPTSTEEKIANFQAAVGLQPEEITRVVAGGGQYLPDRLYLVTKPRNQVQHKGGAVVNAQDDGDQCMVSWLIGATDGDACQRAATRK